MTYAGNTAERNQMKNFNLQIKVSIALATDSYFGPKLTIQLGMA